MVIGADRLLEVLRSDPGFLILDNSFPVSGIRYRRIQLALANGGQDTVIVDYFGAQTGLWHLLDFFPGFE